MYKQLGKFLFIQICIGLTIMQTLNAQKSLPDFDLKKVSSGIQISWTNPFPNCVQLSVQRSYTQNKGFSTIFSPLTPSLTSNGFIDKDIPDELVVYYRIFYVLENGDYFFSSIKATNKIKSETSNPIVVVKDTIATPKAYFLQVQKKGVDSFKLSVSSDNWKAFKDSIKLKTKDTLVNVGFNSFQINPYVPKAVWVPSKYIYKQADNKAVIKLEDYDKHSYKVVFFNAQNETLFTLKQFQGNFLFIEPSNFSKSGWYFFELYKDEKLVEKNKVFIDANFD